MVRQWASKRMTSIVRLQACIRTMIARKKYRRQKIEFKKLQEAERLRMEEEQRLKRKMNEKKAKQERKGCTRSVWLRWSMKLMKRR